MPEKVTRDYLGGAGFGALYLYRENPDGIHWSAPENRLIIANGPLSNTPFHGSGTLSFVSKGPMTGLAVSTQANGFGGARLKSCGLDGIVINGAATGWVYLYVSDASVELRNAGHLIGKDTLDTQDILKEGIDPNGKASGISVFCIGPAGEHKVRFSVIMGDGTHTASKGGLGAVMGAKRLKAIVIARGNTKPSICDHQELIAIAKELHHGATVTYNDGSRHKWGTNGADAGTVFYLTDLADRLGVDVNETGWVLGWVMECFEKGVLQKSDLDGLDMTWGNSDSVAEILRGIAERKGFGNLLAEGVKRAAERIGGEAVSMAVCTVKGATPRGHDHRARWHELVDTCLTNTSTLEATFVGVRPHLMDMPPVHDAFSPWEVPLVNAHQNGWAVVEDCLGACRFNMNYPKKVLSAYNAVTGADMSLPDVITIGKRIVNTFRMFNIRNGLTPELEAPSLRYGSAPSDGPAEGKRILDYWPHIREFYYKSMGWDPKTGIPLPDTLRSLGLLAED